MSCNIILLAQLLAMEEIDEIFLNAKQVLNFHLQLYDALLEIRLKSAVTFIMQCGEVRCSASPPPPHTSLCL